MKIKMLNLVLMEGLKYVSQIISFIMIDMTVSRFGVNKVNKNIINTQLLPSQIHLIKT